MTIAGRLPANGDQGTAREVFGVLLERGGDPGGPGKLLSSRERETVPAHRPTENSSSSVRRSM
ncbi:hypothetical protein AKJ09_08165 [Labilithrix luteola]|uniref:Uncharacterized protein n=1 Tax=Labilithrix luteola TaxID=1391654 RepID=A0A0K1Q765_9BACT|nr:hypothetical protein AKJ09_08165 [Labilithrix luteola]